MGDALVLRMWLVFWHCLFSAVVAADKAKRQISYQQVVLAIEFDGVSASIELEDPGENEWLCVTDATGNVNSVHDSIVIEDLPATVAVQTGPFCDATS